MLKAIELNPRLGEVYVRLAGIYQASGKTEQAIGRLNDALALNPRSQPLLVLTAVLYDQQGKKTLARERYEKALEINPDLAAASNNLAYLLAEQGVELDRAVQLAEKAREAAPEDPNIADTLGWILYKKGVYPRALDLLKESVAKLEDNAEVHFHLGMVQYKLSDKLAARESLNRALQLNPSFPGADEAKKVLAELN
jgi:Tfp pilus assembly protein PilF